jgi:hypothetical protein
MILIFPYNYVFVSLSLTTGFSGCFNYFQKKPQKNSGQGNILNTIQYNMGNL